MLSRHQLITFLTTLILLHGSVFGQDSLFLAKTDRIQSEVLHEERIIHVYLPHNYHPDSAVLYPVIYLLDGSANEDFIHVTGITQFLEMTGEMKPCIVVGIANVDRKRDFTFPTTVEKDKQDYPTTGGSEHFMNFVEQELIPFVQTFYKASSQRTLIGQSLGGLLACEFLSKRTALFENYLIVSPSLWWDQESLFNSLESETLQFGTVKRIYLAVGKEHPTMVKDARKLAGILERHLGKQFQFEYLKQFDHANILHQAAYDGLRWLFD